MNETVVPLLWHELVILRTFAVAEAWFDRIQSGSQPRHTLFHGMEQVGAREEPTMSNCLSLENDVKAELLAFESPYLDFKVTIS